MAKPASMSAHYALRDLYHQWRQLTEQEGNAIRSASWARVAECQNHKLQLQERILIATRQLRAETPIIDPRWKDLEMEFNQILDHLISLEKRNSQWLAEQQRQAEIQGGELGRSQLHLRQLHRAYVRSSSVAWQSYS